jgi:enoyl-CoA hydratase/carnithine racemase
MRIDDHGDGVRGVVFTRAEDGNFITSAGLVAFAEALDVVLAKPGLRAVVLSGEGENFCSGRIGAKGLTSAADVAADLSLILEVNSRLRSSPVPFVAAVEGKAFGFGCGFSTQCDITVAGEGARFALPEMSHRLPPLIVLSYFGTFVPFKRAFELALTSREFGATEARDIGIVTEVVPTGGAFDRALAFARQIAALDAESVRLLRAFSRRVAGLTDDHEARTGVADMAIMIAARTAAGH